jgi:Family of unknown function (DUF6496)
LAIGCRLCVQGSRPKFALAYSKNLRALVCGAKIACQGGNEESYSDARIASSSRQDDSGVNPNFERSIMPEKATIERAREDAREGKSPSTQAGEFVREEIDHVREGKHGARSPQQAIAIGLSKARRAGIKLPPPKGPASIRKKAAQDLKAGQGSHKTSARRSRATENALQRESRSSTSRQAMSGQARKAAAKRGKRARSAAAIKAARTRRAA